MWPDSSSRSFIISLHLSEAEELQKAPNSKLSGLLAHSHASQEGWTMVSYSSSHRMVLLGKESIYSAYIRIVGKHDLKCTKSRVSSLVSTRSQSGIHSFP